MIKTVIWSLYKPKKPSIYGNLSLIGAWSGHVTHYKILGAPIVSLERLNLKSSNFVHE